MMYFDELIMNAFFV